MIWILIFTIYGPTGLNTQMIPFKDRFLYEQSKQDLFNTYDTHWIKGICIENDLNTKY